MTERTKRWTAFSLRSLLILVTIVAAILGLRTRAKHFRNLAAEHHFKAMDAGYQAAAIQRPVDLRWEWKRPAPMKMDHATISKAAPFWQVSRYHAEQRDVYLAAAQRPWLPVQAMPPNPSPVVVPDGDGPAAQWWNAMFGAYAEHNQCLLEPHMGFPPADDQNLNYAQTLLTAEQFSSLQSRFRERRGIAIGR
ncbi:hypothetical protein Enr13x_58940 [Stieleria neptunia]|uniref:Uncharacterized protein n=1 Tax=Stieleria neptunia TaxID=2527979 RepID=A0A518HYR2_9BACT|nr:hypothetical protein [Stieleria neptunia]QDV45990.1 hypothetical protein Enr13x_58940 [Stieleria neptunia]